MKENRNPNIQKQTLKRKYNVLLIVQILLLLSMIALGIAFLFVPFMLPYLLVSAILFLWSSAYYNFRHLGKTKIAILYIIGSLLIVLQMLGI